MILYLYAFKDKKLGAFTNIYTDNLDPNKEKVVIERGLKNTKDIQKLKAYADIQVYSLGVFDDESGEIKSVMPDFIIDAGDIVYGVLASQYADSQDEKKVRVNSDETEN